MKNRYEKLDCIEEKLPTGLNKKPVSKKQLTCPEEQQEIERIFPPEDRATIIYPECTPDGNYKIIQFE